MPSMEDRLELVEEELRLVKGEIKRTLVDLRTVTMEAAAPFREAPFISRGKNEPEAREVYTYTDGRELAEPPFNGTPQGVRNPEVSPEVGAQSRLVGTPLLPASLDVNLISSLIGWVSIAQERLGPHRLEGFLELYSKATAHSTGLKEIIRCISTVLGNNRVSPGKSPGELDIAQQWKDLMLQLHGILTGHCAPPTIPNLGLSGLIAEEAVKKDG